ncbi:hypothetical protein ACLOJK_037691 [Asimina triloba]
MARTGATSSIPTLSSKGQGKRKVMDPPSLIQKKLRPRRLQSSVKINDQPVHIDSPSSSSLSGSLSSSSPERASSDKPPRWVKKIDLKGETPSKLSSYDFIKEATLKRMRYKKDKNDNWVYRDDVQDTSSQEPSVPPTDVNVEDFLVDPDDNLGGAGSHFSKTVDPNDVVTAGCSGSTQPVSPSGVLFSTPSTATSRPTMSSTSMPSTSQFHGVTGSSGSQSYSFEFSTLQSFIRSQFASLSDRLGTLETSSSSRIGTVETRFDSLVNEFNDHRRETNSSLHDLK